MRRVTKLSLLAISIILLGCTREEPSVKPEAGNIVTMTASMTDDSSTTSTKVNLGQEEMNIKLTWKAGDQIHLVFLEGGTAKAKTTVTLAAGNIFASGKKASLSFAIPAAITGDKFDIYGVHGGGGFESEGSYNLLLPTAAQSTGTSLEALQTNNAVMLKFSKTDIPKSNPCVSVSFAHLGSLFHIALKNTGASTMSGITKAELVSSSAIQANQNSGSATYNPVDGTFTGTSTTGTSLPFDISSTDLAAGGTLNFWGWYPSVAGENWPSLGLKINTTGTTYSSSNAKDARTSAIEAGKAYHLYATYDGTQLSFTNSSGTITYGSMFDSRDNNVYKTVTIGTQTWMAENLKYLTTLDGYVSDGNYAYQSVYGYTGTNVDEAKATSNYQTYGVLYNWFAAMNGESSSNANPSGVQGVCPTGWHLASSAEWGVFLNYLADNGYSCDGESPGDKTFKSLAASSGWTSSSVAGAPGNTDFPEYRNKSGFSALPAGIYYGGGFNQIGQAAGFWGATKNSGKLYYVSLLMYYNVSSYTNSLMYRESGYRFSVRCVKN